MINPTGKGQMISPQKASKFLTDYLSTLKNPEDAAYGHLFGFDKIEELVRFISDYNQSMDPSDQIAGIRIYNCLDLARSTSDKSDVFLIPVLKNGNDLYDVNNLSNLSSLDGGGGILGEPVPCPNFCDPNE